MTWEEVAILEAAQNLWEMQRALDCGVPVQAQKRRAYTNLMSACDALASYNDGHYKISYPVE